MDSDTLARVHALQERIDAALHESAEEAGRTTFSSYMPGGSTDLQSALWTKPAAGGVEDIEEILDRFDQLRGSDDAGRLRHALTVVLTHHPTAAAFGLQLPGLEERSPSKVWPSKRT